MGVNCKLRPPRLDHRLIERSLKAARRDLAPFGRQPVTTADGTRLLARFDVSTQLADLPLRYAALLSPVAFGGRRFLALARHVPRLGRRLVILHEAAHLYQRTAQLGIAYDNEDWHSPAEAAADAFAAVGLLPRFGVDEVLEHRLWARDVEDELAAQLMHFAEGVWDEERALFVARNRLVIRERLGV